MTAADRPSVTDNARANPDSIYYEPPAWCPGCGDRIPTEVIRERGVCSNCYGTTDDPWAAARAETTTATTEDAVGELLERMSNAVTRLETLRAEQWYPPERQRLHGKTEGVKLAASYVEEARDLLATARTATTEDAEEVLHGAGWFARADLDPRDLRGILHDLADAGLLARPLRDGAR